MADVSKYTGLITSEHADKPKFNAMVSAVAQCFVDQQNALGNFIPSFDLDEAVGDQLDTLGAWVGISRRVRTPLTGVYFSFDIAGVGFDQGVWQGPFDPSTGITLLDDDTYRLLIRAKIGANHWDGTLASSAAILNLIFQGGTTPRHLTATNEQFGIGNGVTGAFHLTVGGVPVSSNISVSSIFRNDWQGNQLLFATARTNLARSSQNWLGVGWNLRTDTATNNNAGAPDGSATLNKITISTSNTGHAQSQDIAGVPNGIAAMSVYVVPGGAPFTSVWLADQLASGSPQWGVVLNTSGQVTFNNGTLAGGQAVITPMGGGVFKVSIQGTITAGTARCVTAFSNSATSAISNTYTGNGTDNYSAWGLMFSAGVGIAQLGSYIATTTAAVTVTDYTLSATGLVTPSPKAASGAVLTWNGSGDAYPSGTQVFIEDNQDMSITFGVAGTIPSALFLALLSGGYIPIKPEGVRVRDYVVTSVSGGPIFGFDMENQFVSGFDVGAWGSPL